MWKRGLIRRMADFCRQCSKEVFGEDFGDLKGLVPKFGPFAAVICEGCGATHVDLGGNCIYHGGGTSEECLGRNTVRVV